jgi:hypothetical protein
MTAPARLRRPLALAGVTLATAAALGALHPTTGGAATCTDDFKGSNMGLWQTASNWTSASDASVHAVPTASDVACLEGLSVVVSAVAQTADSVQGMGGSLQITGGSLTLTSTSDNSTLDDLSLDDSGGLTAPVAQTITVDGNFEWGTCSSCGNEISLSATIDQTGGGTFAIDGPGSGLSGPTLTGGSLTTSSPVSITNPNFGSTGAESLTTTSTITLGSGLQLNSLSSATTITAAGIASNSGTYGFWNAPLVLTGGTTTVVNNSTLETGRLTVEGGTVKDDSGITAAPGGSLTTTLTGGTLTGGGNIMGPVTNVGATVSPGDTTLGTFTISGNYTQQAGGTLAVGIDGTAHGLLQVSGTATLGGDLQLTDVNGFLPAAGEEWVLLPSAPTQTGTFTLTGPSAPLYTVTYASDAVDLFPLESTPPRPADITPPAITGTPTPGQTLSCSPGSWSNGPTSYAYQWNRDGSAITGATADTYGAQSTDVGHQLTCTVIATNGAGPGPAATSPAVTAQNPTMASTMTTTTTATTSVSPATTPPARLGVPVDTIRPAVSGTPTPGHALTCSTGTWTNSPTVYAYQWRRSATAPLTRATAGTYAVQIADEGSPLTCTVTASNAAGAGRPATSAPTVVAERGTLDCARPTGRLAALSVGPLALGFTRAHARRILHRFAVTANDFDNFCLYGGWGIRVGYATGRILSPLSPAVRAQVNGRIVLALTANPFYALRGARPGMALAAIAKRLKVGQGFRIGSNVWYLAPGTPARGVLKVRAGIIEEVGLASERLTSGNPSSQRRFLASFGDSAL